MIFSAFERFVAMRYLRARRQEGFISVIAGFSVTGIALGVATLIIVMSVMNGFRAELLGRILGLNGHVSLLGDAAGIADPDAAVAKAAALPGVVLAMPTVEAQALTISNGQASGAIIRGVRPDDFARRPLLSASIIAGDPRDFAEDRIAIGLRMAQRLGLNVGDKLTVVSPRGSSTAFGTLPRTRAYPIAAIFDVGMYEYDNAMIFMPLAAAQSFLSLGGVVTQIDLFLDDLNAIARQRDALAAAFAGEARALDWQQSNASLFTAVQVERNVMFLILSLIITVAAFNIISSLIMLVKDKGRDIAILRTMGATQGMILRIFLLSGASIGITGALIGFGLGVTFALNIESVRQFIQYFTGTDLFNAELYFLSQLPAKLDWQETGLVTAMALGLSFAATLYPAWRAARLDPVEALRYA
jgi:lipoprotein-releasing system permease protein